MSSRRLKCARKKKLKLIEIDDSLTKSGQKKIWSDLKSGNLNPEYSEINDFNNVV